MSSWSLSSAGIEASAFRFAMAAVPPPRLASAGRGAPQRAGTARAGRDTAAEVVSERAGGGSGAGRLRSPGVAWGGGRGAGGGAERGPPGSAVPHAALPPIARLAAACRALPAASSCRPRGSSGAGGLSRAPRSCSRRRLGLCAAVSCRLCAVRSLYGAPFLGVRASCLSVLPRAPSFSPR